MMAKPTENSEAPFGGRYYCPKHQTNQHSEGSLTCLYFGQSLDSPIVNQTDPPAWYCSEHQTSYSNCEKWTLQHRMDRPSEAKSQNRMDHRYTDELDGNSRKRICACGWTKSIVARFYNDTKLLDTLYNEHLQQEFLKTQGFLIGEK